MFRRIPTFPVYSVHLLWFIVGHQHLFEVTQGNLRVRFFDSVSQPCFYLTVWPIQSIYYLTGILTRPTSSEKNSQKGARFWVYNRKTTCLAFPNAAPTHNSGLGTFKFYICGWKINTEEKYHSFSNQYSVQLYNQFIQNTC